MKKKDNTPFLLKVVQWTFPKLEWIAPSLAHRLFRTLFFSPLHYPVPARERKAETFAEKFTLNIAGKKVQCYTWGKSERSVLVVHGWAGRATQFRRFIKPLIAAGFSVTGFDAPAHGNSSGGRTTIVEFEETLRAIYEKKGIPEAIIAHSFGGGAVLFSATHGLPVKTLINIASPTIAEEIIDTYLRVMHASGETKKNFKAYVLRTTGRPFEEFTALYLIHHLPKPLRLMLVHDSDDHEVVLAHATALQKAYPSARLLQTSGLGHTRILKDDNVIAECVTFIQAGTSA